MSVLPRVLVRDNYYFVNGSWNGTWDEVPRQVIMMNWNYTRFDGQSPRFFAGRGFSQIIFGDGPEVGDWLRKKREVSNIVGVLDFIAPSLGELAQTTWIAKDRAN